MALDKLAFVGAGNAIQSVSFVIEWDGPRSDELIAAMSGLAPQMLKLGYQQESVFALNFNFAIKTDAAHVTTQAQELAGHTFKKSSRGTTLREMSLRENQFIVNVFDYSRWANVWADVSELIGYFAPLITAASKPIRSVGMQYVDKFIWRDPKTVVPLSEILKYSPFLAVNAISQKKSWHSHHGFFTEPMIDWAGTRLDNVNISVENENGQQALSIVTAHKYSSAGGHTQDNNDFFQKTLPEIFDEAHKANKSLMCDLLTEEVCKMISLETSA